MMYPGPGLRDIFAVFSVLDDKMTEPLFIALCQVLDIIIRFEYPGINANECELSGERIHNRFENKSSAVTVF